MTYDTQLFGLCLCPTCKKICSEPYYEELPGGGTSFGGTCKEHGPWGDGS